MHEPLEFDLVIIGGGAVGLACAYHLSTQPLSILLLEQHERFGTECSARNSEVIHAGIYYSAGSLKERLCIEGKERLYSFCKEQEVPYRQCGKWIVGNTQEDLPALERLLENARRNNVELASIDSGEARRREPHVSSRFVLDSPTTGILDSESYMQKLAFLAEENGVTLMRQSRLVHWEKSASDYLLEIAEPGVSRIRLAAKQVINASGWSALQVAGPIFSPEAPFSLKYVRGHYFSLRGKGDRYAGRLIYPVPDPRGGGLGIHLTLDLGGGARLGPDTDWRWPDKVDCAFHEADIPELKSRFHQVAQRYLPELSLDDLEPGFVGVRPKLVDPSGKMLDFYIAEESARGFPGWVNLLGIESPGLTASLAIADQIAQLFA